MADTHHHSLQHRQVSQVAGESDSPDPTSPYSRTPALRASHKMAERKRRTEMKYLFDGLRAQIPANHGSKSSKWEILSKDHDAIKRENDSLRAENQRLFQEMNAYRETRQANMVQHPQGMPHHYAPPHPTHAPAPLPVDLNRSLPPLNNG
ncbi:MAG: hypothetical protein Q9177_004557, partial [Variospora cf. flavescens]